MLLKFFCFRVFLAPASLVMQGVTESQLVGEHAAIQPSFAVDSDTGACSKFFQTFFFFVICLEFLSSDDGKNTGFYVLT